MITCYFDMWRYNVFEHKAACYFIYVYKNIIKSTFLSFFLDLALMEEFWTHPASISAYNWLMCKVTSTADFCNVLIAFYHLMFLNKYNVSHSFLSLNIFKQLFYKTNNNWILLRFKTSANFIQVSIIAT